MLRDLLERTFSINLVSCQQYRRSDLLFAFSLARFSERHSLLCSGFNGNEAQHLLDSVDVGSHAWDIPAHHARCEHQKTRLFDRSDYYGHFCTAYFYRLSVKKSLPSLDKDVAASELVMIGVP